MAQIEPKLYIAGVSDNGDGTFTVKQETKTKNGKKVYEHESRFVAYRDENGRVTAEKLDFGKPIPGRIQNAERVPFKEIETLFMERMAREDE